MDNLIIKNISKKYNQRHIVNNFSMSMQAGEIIGLLGPNGAGKTTCFYMILGLITCDAGEIFLNNHNITALPIHNRAKLGLGYLPQEPSVFRKLTVMNNILAILELRTNLKSVNYQNELNKLLNEFNLMKVKDVLGISLSGGERRRLEIARTLAANPKFILLDEPFAGVDPLAITEIKKILKQLAANNIGIIITDHNVRDTLDICDRAYIMNNGSLIASGTPEQIVDHAQVREVYLGREFRV